ncbi:MAG TPA: folate-binding protein [Rhodanobacteraceae bacterium]
MTRPFPVLGRTDCIAIEGAAARDFAHAQFSGDVNALMAQRWQWNAWLTPSGRVRALLQLVDAGDGRLLAVLRGGSAENICAGLSRYLLRTRATLRVVTLTARAGAALTAGSTRVERGSLVLGLGERSLRLDCATDAEPDVAAQAAWRLADIDAGWPTLTAQTESMFLPPALGLERMGAVAFDKGCYPGQEIATRIHHRDACKYRLFHVRGRVPVASGSAAQGTSAAGPWIVDQVVHGHTSDALIVAPRNSGSSISALHDTYDVVSMFHA